jgi:hypothetical protein
VSGQPEANRVIGSSKYWPSATYTNPPDPQLLGSYYYYAPSFNDYLGYLSNTPTLFNNLPSGWYIDYSGNNGYSFFLTVTGTDGNYGLQVNNIYINTAGTSEAPTPPWTADPTKWTKVDGTITIAANGATIPLRSPPGRESVYINAAKLD